MLKKLMAFLVVLTLMVAAICVNVSAAPVQGKLKVDWYDLGPETEENYNKIRALRDQGKLDTILESDLSTFVKTSELSQVQGEADGFGLLFMNGSKMGDIVKANVPDKSDPNTFGMVITGYITPKEDGKYKFRLLSDDSSRLKLGDTWIVGTWGQPESDGRTWDQERISNEIELKAGQAYPIRVEYFDGWGGHKLEITWSKDNGEFAMIPAEVFSYDNAATGPETEEPSQTSDVSMLMPLLVAGAAAFGALKFRKK